MTPRATLDTRPYIRLLVIGLCLAALCQVDTGAVKMAWEAVSRLDGQAPTEVALNDQYEALYDEVVTQIPSGSDIVVSDVSETGWGDQRLFEFALMNDITVVSNSAEADFAVTIVTSSDGQAHLIVEQLL